MARFCVDDDDYDDDDFDDYYDDYEEPRFKPVTFVPPVTHKSKDETDQVRY